MGGSTCRAHLKRSFSHTAILRIVQLHPPSGSAQYPTFSGLHPGILALIHATTQTPPMEIDTFTGGIFDTNCFFLPAHGILVDAPQEAATWLERRKYKVDLLLLTHGHIDHVWDAARIQRQHQCRVGYHPETLPMVTDPQFFRRLGFAWDIDPIAPDLALEASPVTSLQNLNFQVLEVPGHCPGSLCFHLAEHRLLFGGDVLFAGGVGRWDLPGGNRDLLLSGIRSKLFTLPEDTTVLPGHGPATRIGIEKSTNPFLQD